MTKNLLLFCTAVAASSALNAQEYVELRNAEVQEMVFFGETVAYRDWDSTRVFEDEAVRDERGLLISKGRPPGYKASRLHQKVNPKALPYGDDPAWQRLFGERDKNRALDITINGQGFTNVNPADPCLDVGPNHVIQMINGSSGSYFRIFDKNGNALGAQTYLDNFVNAIGGITTYGGAGDPIVLYDAIADRWLMSEFSSSGNRMIVAISTTADPTGTWYAYSFTAPSFPDYPKYAVWSSMYLITTNENQTATYALDRSRMLQGLSATAQRFTVPDVPTLGFQATTPITHDGGAAPPAGAPGMFMRMADDGWGASIPNDRLELWSLTVNFTTPANSVLSGPVLLATQPFDTELCGYQAFQCIPQPGTTTTLDPLREVIMNRAVYRNFGSHEAIVCSHVTDVTGTDRAGVRWYELRRSALANPWGIHQQGTYSPDAANRWMSSIAINANGDIGLSYNVSSSSVFPSIRYTGRSASDPLGQMTIAETSIVAGTSRNASNRYGDYNSLDVDPANGSFWGTAKFNTSTSWSTRIFKFSLGTPECIAPQATASHNCINLTQHQVSVNIASMGSATSLTIQIDPDGAGPQPPATVGNANAPGNYGPYGPYPSGTLVNVVLLHNAFPSCNVTLSGVGGNCTSPGQACTIFNSTAPTNIVDNTTVTNSIIVPSQGGATITDLNVHVNITHTWVADLRISLQSPQGTIVSMIASAKCGDADNIVVEFDDSGTDGAVGSICPLTGLFVIPVNALSAFNGQLFQGTWILRVQDVATQDQGVLNNWCLIPTLNNPTVGIQPRVLLEGPYTGGGLMSDALRSGGLIPLAQPYSGLGYSFIGGGSESTTAPVLAVTGNNAIVDWVIVELRNSSNPATIVASRAALMQRDGDIVDVDGISAVSITAAAGNYYVAVRHRNHLGIMTAAAQALSSSPLSINFTLVGTATFGTAARKDVSGTQVMWSGNVDFNTQLAYTGSPNDRDPILQRVGGTVPTTTVSGYYSEDVNMDGLVRYIGDPNDRDPILVNIGGSVPTNVRVQQLP